jgi:hypothetical protein
MSVGDKSVIVMKCFTDHPGMIRYINELVEETGLTVNDVKRTISNLRQNARYSETAGRGPHPMSNLRDAVRGQAWVYQPNQQAAPQVVTTQRPVVLKNAVPEPPPERPAPRPTGKTFEWVGRTPSGNIIVKDEKDHLFKLVPLE